VLALSRLLFLGIFLTLAGFVFAQDNSPYSRYGIGDITPTTNVINRSIGGVNAGYIDHLSINFNNPASFAFFQAYKEKKSKKISSGRTLLDVGIDAENRTLLEKNNPEKFTAHNVLFSYLQVAAPLRQNWGMSFGLRPVSRMSYNIVQYARLYDPISGNNIDSAVTRFHGDGGMYLASLGTGFALFTKERHGLQEKMTIGFTGGYLFGRKNFSSRRSFINDSISYYQANYQTTTNFGHLYLNTGWQYFYPLSKKMALSFGAYGNLGQNMNATEDRMRETFFYDPTLGESRLDSVYDVKNVKGKIKLPASYTIGFVLQKFASINKEGGFLIGADYTQTKWSDYRYYGQLDSTRNSWQLKMGAQITPKPGRGYFTNVTYRFGFYTGTDYLKVQNKLPINGLTAGVGLPVSISRQAPNQITFVNIGMEYAKRGNKNNLLKENLFRLTLGFSLSDAWFIKRKYE
jgi:hypothetical protein